MKTKIIAGPCVIEDYQTTIEIAKSLKELSENPQIDFYFKASFDKANRTSMDSYRGPGLQSGLELLNSIKNEFGYKIITDIHEPDQAKKISAVADIIQIPAFLCRQTDLIVAAARTGKTINVKKGQFLAPWDMISVIDKIEKSGNNNIMITERGTTFGYNRLVVDMTSIYELKKLNYPVIFDATHSVQRPGGLGDKSSGNREYVDILSKAAIAAGADGLFLETHINPRLALSDGPNMVGIVELYRIIDEILKIKGVLVKV